MILAAATDMTAAGLGYWMIAAGLVIPAASAVLAVFITRREVESMKAESDRRHAAHETTQKEIFSRLGGQERGLRAEAKADVTELRNKVDKIAEDVSSVATAAEMHTQQLAALNSDIKQLLAR